MSSVLALRVLYDRETGRSRCGECGRLLATGQAACICGARLGIPRQETATCCGDPGDCHNAERGGC